MRMLPPTEVARGTANDPAAGYISPSFREDEAPDVVHHIIRNPEMLAQGIDFRFDIHGRSEKSIGGFIDKSHVYEVAFAYRPRAETPRFIAWKELKHGPVKDDWSLMDGTYYDLSEPIASDADVYAVPIATSPTSANSNVGRFRYNDDLVVTFQWLAKGSLRFDRPQVRASSRSVRKLVDELTVRPIKRDLY